MEQLAHISVSLNGREVNKELHGHTQSVVVKDSLSRWTPGMGVFLRGWWWHWHCLTSLSLTWTVGSGAPSANSVATPKLCGATGRGGMPSRGAWGGGSGRTW